MRHPAPPPPSARAGTLLPHLFSTLARPTSVLILTLAASLLLRTVSTVILTRLLSPSVFGLAGIITSFMYTAIMLTDLGFQSFIIRHHRGDENYFKNVIWTVHATRGVMLAAIGICCAPLVAQILDKSTLALPLAIASLQFAINGFASFSLITALRSNGANKLSLLDLLISTFQTITCIVLAIWLQNIWAIVGAMLTQSVLRTVLSYAIFVDSGHRPKLDRSIRKEFFAFSRIVMASSFLTLLLAQGDKLFLAKFFSLEQFGLYAIAINIIAIPTAFIGSYLQRIVYPTYTKVWKNNPDYIANAYYATRRKGGFLFAAGVGSLIGGSHLLVRILYDPRYADAAIFIAILAINPALRFLNTSATELMTAIGKVKFTLYTNIVRLFWLTIAGSAGFILEGSIGIIIAVGTMEIPAMLYCWLFLRKAKVLNICREFSYLTVVAGGALLSWQISSILLPYLPV